MGDGMTTLTMADVAAARIELYKRGLCPLTEADIAPKLIPVFEGPADFRYAFGGRGGTKSVGFQKMAATTVAIWDAMGRTGVVLCVREFMNSLDDSILQDIKNAIADDPWLTSVFDVGEKYVRTKSGRIKFIFAGTSVNLDSIKSKSKVLLVLAEEAESITSAAWEKIVPTVREDGSEVWAIWNPETEKSWVHKNLRMSDDPMTKGTEISWRDNPWWSEKLERVRKKAEREDPDNYDHVWEGQFKTQFKGAYYATQLREAREQGRVGFFVRDPDLMVRTYWDLGRRDFTAIWVCQFLEGEIRVLDYVEANGQNPGYYFEWLRNKGYKNCYVGLPHDGAHVNPDNPTGASYLDQALAAGFDAEIVKSGHKGAPMQRIDATRKLFPQIRFNEKNCRGGLVRLGAYRAQWNEKLDEGMGPLHDESSHSADAFGLMCVNYEPPREMEDFDYDAARAATGAW